MQVGFTARQVMHLTGLPYSTLNLWAKNGLVHPSIAPGAGTGSERIYSFTDLVALKVAFELRKSGVTTSSLKKVVNFLQQNESMENPLAEARLVVSGRDVLVVRNQRELVSALSKPGQSCLSFVVDLPHMVGELVELVKVREGFMVGIASTQETSARYPGRQPVSAASSRERRRVRR